MKITTILTYMLLSLTIIVMIYCYIAIFNTRKIITVYGYKSAKTSKPPIHTIDNTDVTIDYNNVTIRKRLNSSLLPSHSNDSSLYPDPLNPWNNRIVTQLNYVPRNRPNVTKTIFLPFMGYYHHGPPTWTEERFRNAGCKVTQCTVTDNVSDALDVDLLILPEPKYTPLRHLIWGILSKIQGKRHSDQIWASFQDESPYHSRIQFREMKFNWTLTYSPRSTIPIPYGERYRVTHDTPTLPLSRNYTANKTSQVLWFASNCDTPNKRMQYVIELSKHINVDIYGGCEGESYRVTHDTPTLPLSRNYAANKTSQVLWFASNCDTPNKRMQYVIELSKHINVDVYGGCQDKLKNNRTKLKPCKVYMGRCMRDVISRYKFYLAFENSNCDTYVTEKYFNTSLGNDIVPIVMGALPSYYAHVSPPHSHIHVEDYKSPAHLARYLHTLDRNDTLYNSYFRWKDSWSVVSNEALDNGLMCRVCAMLHAPRRRITNTHEQWRKNEHCRNPALSTA